MPTGKLLLGRPIRRCPFPQDLPGRIDSEFGGSVTIREHHVLRVSTVVRHIEVLKPDALRVVAKVVYDVALLKEASGEDDGPPIRSVLDALRLELPSRVLLVAEAPQPVMATVRRRLGIDTFSEASAVSVSGYGPFAAEGVLLSHSSLEENLRVSGS